MVRAEGRKDGPFAGGESMAKNESELERVEAQTRGRLESLNVRLDGRESPDELVSLLEAVERFEEAVEARGGDLMVDEPERGKVLEPDDPAFVLPKRRPEE